MSNKPSKDLVSRCTFTFADGRQCKTPRQPGDADFCYFHSQRELRRLAARNAGDFIASGLSTDYVSACALNGTLGRLFRAVASGQISPKTAHTLGYLAQIMAQTLPMAEDEFARTFGDEPLVATVTSAFGKLNPKFVQALEDSSDEDENEDKDEFDDDDEDSADSAELDEHDHPAEPGDAADPGHPDEPDNSAESEVPDEPADSTQPDSPPPSVIPIAPSTPDSPNPDPTLPRIVFR
jgi:hypothetical protein